jgi:hypothetical protein
MALVKIETVGSSETSETSIGLLGHTSQETVLFIVIAVRTSDPISLLHINLLH